ncbi:amidohydrolase [Floridanema evergladense]
MKRKMIPSNTFLRCTCCNPLLGELLLQLTRRKFLVGTGAFAAAVMAGNGQNRTVQAQTEGIRIIENDPEAVQQLEPEATIFTAKKVVTMEQDRPQATAVAVVGDRIIAVGSLEDVKGMVGNRSYTIDRTFENKVILPGFVEHHIHPLLGVLTMSAEIIAIEEWKVPGKYSAAVQDEATYVARLREALAKMESADPNETLLTWGYHHYFHGKVYRPQLDQIEPNRPVIIWHRSCHEFILNTPALEKYGVTEATLQGKGLASEQASWEDGHFFEKGMEIILPFIGKELANPQRVAEGMRIYKSFLLSKGITTTCEPGTIAVRAIHEFWEEQLDKDDTSFRTYFMPDGRSLFDQYKTKLNELLPKVESFLSWGRGKVQWLPMQIKLFADGAIFSQLMQVEQPYLDGHQGQWIAVPEDYAAAFKIFWDAGYQIHTHVNGDAGLQVVVDSLKTNMQANPRDNHRCTVVHFAVSTDEQVIELGNLSAIISANPYYVTSLADRYSEVGLGAARANEMVRLGSVAKTPMAIGLHSDMPMAPADPLFLAWCAATRTTVSGRIATPEQRISVERALNGVTLESAYFMQLENEIGSIKAGKKADFAILEQDPFDVPSDQLKDIVVWGVVFEGEKFQSSQEPSSTSAAPSVQFAIDKTYLADLTQPRG